MKTDLENCAEKIEYEVNDGHVRAVFGNITDLLEVHGARLNALRNEIQVVEKQAVNEDVVIFGGNSNIGEFFVKSVREFLIPFFMSNFLTPIAFTLYKLALLPASAVGRVNHQK